MPKVKNPKLMSSIFNGEKSNTNQTLKKESPGFYDWKFGLKASI